MDINKNIIFKKTLTFTNSYYESHVEKIFSVSGIGNLIAVHINSKDKVALATCSKSMLYCIKDITKSEVTTACKAIAKKIQQIVPKSEKERDNLVENQNRILLFLSRLNNRVTEYDLSYIPLFQDMACDILLNLQLKVAQLESEGLYKSTFTNELKELPLQITSLNHELNYMVYKVSSFSLVTFVINMMMHLTQNDYKSLHKNKVVLLIDSEIKKKHFLIAERIIDLYGKFFMGKSIYLEKLLIECERNIGFIDTKRILKKSFSAVKQENQISIIRFKRLSNFLQER